MNPHPEPVLPELQAFEEYRQCMRQRYANDRVALAEVMRTIMAGRVPARATMLVASLGYDSLILGWDQGTRNRSVTYNVQASYIPQDMDTFATMALTLENFSELNVAILSDLVVDAWTDAGGFAFSRPLALWRTLMDSPAVVPETIRAVRDTIRRLAALRAAGQPTTKVPIPVANTFPAIHADHLAACQRGDADALANWAATLDTTGHTQAANNLRWLQEFRDRITEPVQAWRVYGQGLMIFRERNETWWSIGEEENSETEDGERDAEILGSMIAAWNDYYPAFEWFFRTLEFTSVHVLGELVSNATGAHNRYYNLPANEHLEPLASTIGITTLDAQAPDAATYS